MDILNKVNFTALQNALDHVALVMGEANLSRHDHGHFSDFHQRRNVSQFRCRNIFAIIRPKTLDHVQDIVRIFGRFKTNVGLHVISTGRNWGLGSAEPTTDGVVTLDLANLSTVRDIDCASGWAVIEPGVTQAQLAQRLAGTDRMLNVTASSGHTSVVGNALDRGVGLRRQRTEDLAGLEVVLPDSEIIRVGWWPDEKRRTSINPHGVGPSLLPLFTQSNLGIVTAAVIRLLHRPEKQCVLRLHFSRDTLENAITELRRWVAQDLVSGVLKIYDAVSTQSYGGKPGQHLALVCVSGTSGRVSAITQTLIDEARACSLFTSVTRSDLEPAASNDFVTQVVEHAYAGDPSKNEHMLRCAVGQDADHVDTDGDGWIFFLPLVPFNGRAVSRALELIKQIHEKTGIRAGSTVNALNADLVDLVVSFKFVPNPENTARAHLALDIAYKLFVDAGFIPYRLDVDHAHWMEKLVPDPSAHNLVRRIKQLIDPDAVIAPGRYA
ncbi:FAD-binding oxidoreductase [Verminephrobacter aporrectodeae]|nr:FAD-binding oxidoreductase [Verminephrobacter aporrectodeae]